MSIECYTADHFIWLSWLAVFLYPICLWLNCLALLIFSARHPDSALAGACSFLYREYDDAFFWWELSTRHAPPRSRQGSAPILVPGCPSLPDGPSLDCACAVEMARKLLLVGLLVPVEAGSITQTTVGTIVCAVYLMLQVYAKPYKNATDDLLATAASFSLLMIFICSILYKVAGLTSSDDIQEKMNAEQMEEFIVSQLAISSVMLASLFGSLILVTAFAIGETIVEGRKRFQREHILQSRRDIKRRELRNELDSPDGLRWSIVSDREAKGGTELTNEALSAALATKTEFTKQEWESFNVPKIRRGSTIRVGGSFFVPAPPQLSKDDKARRDLCREALDKMEKIDASRHKSAVASLQPAETLFGVAGIPPTYWGLSKKQLEEFRKEVHAAINDGSIKNQPDPDKPFYYPQAKFDDPEIGPNMHQTNAGLIKPLTMDGSDEDPTFMPGLSYSLMRNFATGGLPCHAFFSHAWDEGVFELIDNALGAWPDGCEGAYICCLSNPQNLNISQLLGTKIEGSPFYQILCSDVVKNFVMLSNVNTAIHSRLWCVFEAHYATYKKIRSAISGEPVELLTGPAQAKLGETEKVARELRDEKETFIKEQLQEQLQSPELLGDEACTRQREEAEQQFRKAAEDVAEAKLTVLQESDADLIDLAAAKCSYASDEVMIRAEIDGNEKEIMQSVVGLIRDVLCGVQEAKGGEPQPNAPGSLALPLNDPTVDLSTKPRLGDSPLYEMQFAGWLRLRPKVEQLIVGRDQLTARAKDMLRTAVDAGLLSAMPRLEVVDVIVDVDEV